MEGYFPQICVIVVAASLLAWGACRLHQPLLTGYFLCGILFGPWGFGMIEHTELLEHISRIGITLLLFLAGLVLHPERLFKHLKIATIVTIGGGLLTALIILGCLILMGLPVTESIIAAFALMFSSTILAVKLLPTTTLHQKRMGSICIAILIAEDILAAIIILVVGLEAKETVGIFLALLLFKSILLVSCVIVVERYILRRMMRSVDQFNEILIMLCLGWCMGIAVLAERIGLSYEIGAFIAGVIMARGKIAYIFSEQLKPLRDFFLMFFFFVLGAEFDLFLAKSVWLPALILSIMILVARPVYMQWLLRISGEEHEFSKEIGFRLGQASEFGLIIGVAAFESKHLSTHMSQLIQLTVILTMMISSYIVVYQYPTPIGVSKGLKKD